MSGKLYMHAYAAASSRPFVRLSLVQHGSNAVHKCRVMQSACRAIILGVLADGALVLGKPCNGFEAESMRLVDCEREWNKRTSGAHVEFVLELHPMLCTGSERKSVAGLRKT